MISAANIDVAETLRKLSEFGIDASFLVPTRTGIEKSIMDATAPLRKALRDSGLHNFDEQQKGQDAKVQINSVIFSRGEVTPSKASLYRPETKNGDPRIWFSGLKAFAEPTDLLAVITSGQILILLNCSKTDVGAFLSDTRSPFWRFYARPHQELPPNASELLSLLNRISAQGYIRTKRVGDTGVGFTLEAELGIAANNSRAPDYKGIELKAGRERSHRTGRTTLFSQIPDWSISRLKGSKDLLLERGRYNAVRERRQLYHQIGAVKPNSYGLMLELDASYEHLFQVFVGENSRERDVAWAMDVLTRRLSEKHGQTFWVTAKCRGRREDECFHYSKARYTPGPSPEKLSLLLESGVISLDYTISELPSGAAKDKGYLFKIRQRDLELLFKAPQQFELA